MSKENAWMTTFTGKRFYPFDPNVDDICIEDIAHHLANECRYAGACKFHYSVAQHCVLGVDFVSEGNELAFLLHDGAEAYLKDFVKNVKRHNYLADYVTAERELQALVYQKFNVSNIPYVEIKRVDYAIMASEAKELLYSTEGWSFPEPPLPVAIRQWPPSLSERLFLDCYYKYAKNGRSMH